MKEVNEPFTADALIQISVHTSSRNEKGDEVFEPIDIQKEAFSVIIDAKDRDDAKIIVGKRLRAAIDSIK